jgi:membrane protease YdiL (CAAX protease family)
VPGLGGAWEEPGWRGFAVPRLQTGRSALPASLVLGMIIAGWHIPLMVAGQVHWSDIVLIFGAVIVFNAVFNSVGGSVLIIMVMHAANNTVSGSFFSPMFAGADSMTNWLPKFRNVAAALIGMLKAVHERGVVLGDLSPDNILSDDATAELAIVDYECSLIGVSTPE